MILSVLRRISPARVTILLTDSAVSQLRDNSSEAQLMEEEPSALSKDDARDDVKLTDDGYEVLDRHVVSLPDPRISPAGHAFLSVYRFASFVFCLSWAVWSVLSYTPQETLSGPLTTSLRPHIPLHIELTCDGAVVVMLVTNYSQGSPCFNETTQQRLGGPDRHFDFDAVVCASADSVYSTGDPMPPLAGTWIRIASGTDSYTCVVDLFSRFPSALGKGNQPMKRLGVESGRVRTFWMRYGLTITASSGDAESDHAVLPVYYELDGVRSNPADSSSILQLRTLPTAALVTRTDVSGLATTWGYFGGMWYLLGLPLVWFFPAFTFCFPGDWLDQQAGVGALSGYHADVLSTIDKPASYLKFGKGVYARLKHALS